jgi:hypothetical protein
LAEVVADRGAVEKVGRVLGLERSEDLSCQTSIRDKGEFGVLACLVLEGGDDLLDRPILARVEALGLGQKPRARATIAA